MTCALPLPLLHSAAWGIFLVGMLAAWGLSSWIATWGIFSARRERASATPEDASAVASEGEDMDQQLSLIEALERKDAVLAAVEEGNAEWIAEAMLVFDRCPIVEGIGEAFRNWMREEGGLRAPRSAHAWGALFGLLKKRGMIVMTGAWRPMQNAASRARLSPVYQKVTSADGVAA